MLRRPGPIEPSHRTLARAFTATGLDPTTNYTFTLGAYNDAGDSDYSFTATATTTDDEWEDVGQLTPPLVLGGPISWFTPLTGQGDGDYFHAGQYQFLYSGGAYNMGPTSFKWLTTGYFSHVEDATGYHVQSELGGVWLKDDQAQAEHDTYAMGPFSSFYAADQKIGVSFGEDPDPDDPGPGVTWTLQRRRPHASVFSLEEVTEEGETGPINPGDTDYRAKFRFTRDDRITEPLTLKFTLTTDPTLTADDYTAVKRVRNPDGAYTESPFNLAGGTITIPAGLTDIEVDVTATDDTTPEWTEAMRLRLDDNDPTYIADHAYDDDDGQDSDGDGSDDDADAVLLLQNNDLNFQLQTGTLVANYNDSNNNNVTDYEEWGTDSDADPDLYEMHLNVPRINRTGASVTLTIPYAFFNVYTTQSKDEHLSAIVPGAVEGTGVYTWNGNAADIPQTIWLEVKQGSTSVEDITCELNSSDNGASPPGFSQKNTAVNFHIQLSANPNGGPSGNVENRQMNWMIGQMSDLYASIEAPPEFKTGTTYDWTVPGNVLHDYVISDTEAHTVSVQNDDIQGEEPLGTGKAWPAVRFFWASTDAASDDRTVTVRIGNVNGQEFEAETNFKDYEPEYTAVAPNIGQRMVARDPNEGSKWLVYLGSNQVHAGSNKPYSGIELFATVELPGVFSGSGTWTFGQLTTTHVSYDANSIRMVYSKNDEPDLLDNAFPYIYPIDHDGNNAGTSHPTGSGIWGIKDNPRLLIQNDWSAFEFDNQFKAYVMFSPPGNDVRWVPLRMVAWHFSVGGTLNPGGDPATSLTFPFTPTNSLAQSGPAPMPPVRVTMPPVWSDNVLGGTWEQVN